jgi:tetratricopeptide (TPR) repeat protein
MKKVFFLLLVIFLSGCTQKVWLIPQGKDQRDFEMDKRECMYEAQLATPPSGAHVHRLGPRDRYGLGAAAATGLLQGIDEGSRVTRLFGFCMYARGYTLIDKTQSVPVVSKVTPPEEIRKPEQTGNTFIGTSPPFTQPSQPQPQLQTPPQTTDTYKGQVVSALEYNNRGFEYHKNAQYNQAIEHFTIALSMENNSFYYVNRGSSFYELKQYDNAISDFKHAINLAPNEAGAYTWCGNVYYKKKSYYEASEYFSKAIAIVPNNAIFYLNRGYAQFKIGNKSMAASDFKKACELGNEDGCNQLKVLENK